MLDKFVFKRLEHIEPFWVLERIMASVFILIGCIVTLIVVLNKPDAYLAAIGLGLSTISVLFFARSYFSKPKKS